MAARPRDCDTVGYTREGRPDERSRHSDRPVEKGKALVVEGYEKGRQLLVDNADKITETVDNVGGFIDEKTGHKYTETITKGVDVVKSVIPTQTSHPHRSDPHRSDPTGVNRTWAWISECKHAVFGLMSRPSDRIAARATAAGAGCCVLRCRRPPSGSATARPRGSSGARRQLRDHGRPPPRRSPPLWAAAPVDKKADPPTPDRHRIFVPPYVGGRVRVRRGTPDLSPDHPRRAARSIGPDLARPSPPALPQVLRPRRRGGRRGGGRPWSRTARAPDEPRRLAVADPLGGLRQRKTQRPHLLGCPSRDAVAGGTAHQSEVGEDGVVGGGASGAPGSGAVDSGAVDSGAVDSGADGSSAVGITDLTTSTPFVIVSVYLWPVLSSMNPPTLSTVSVILSALSTRSCLPFS